MRAYVLRRRRRRREPRLPPVPHLPRPAQLCLPKSERMHQSGQPRSHDLHYSALRTNKSESPAYKASSYAAARQRAQAPLKAGARARARGKRRASKLGCITQTPRRKSHQDTCSVARGVARLLDVLRNVGRHLQHVQPAHVCSIPTVQNAVSHIANPSA